MNYSLAKLKNGLRVITIPVPNMESATVTIWVNVGSRYETAKIAGVSHFLEHMPAKGTLKRPTAKKVSEAIDSFGGQFNAGTSKEWTNYYIKARKVKIPLAFDILSDMVLSPLLREEDIEKEKGVIVEEISMYEDTPMMHIGDIFERLIFRGSQLGRDIIGSKKTVKAMKRSDFVNFRKKYYGSNSILVTVAGAVTPDQVNKLVENHLGALTKVKRTPIKKFSTKQQSPRVLLEHKKAEQAHLILGFHGNERGHKDRFAETVLTTILGAGMSSRMFTEVREKRGLAYSIRTSGDHYDDAGYIDTYAGVAPKQVDEAVKVILDQHYGLASGEYKISSKEIKKAKEFIKGHIALALEDTRSLNRFFGIRELKLGRMETPAEVYAGVDKVVLEDILRVAKATFKPEKLNLALIGPYKNKGRFEKLVS